MIHRVAQQVHQGVADLFHDGLVQLGVGTADLQIYIFAQFEADIAHHTLEAVKSVADRHHAQAQRAVADFLDQA
ncbi:hypothetical protein D3C81_2116030 [compost metagenome]